jgi:polyhydroxyalkanoate synthesis repressor PhaR
VRRKALRDDWPRKEETLRVGMTETTETGEKSPTRVVIKKYANRRLYNTASSSYVTLEHLSDMVKQGVDFVVFDAKTNEDITRPVLAQIIFEEESRGQNLLPIQFLRQLIRFYGDSMQTFLPSYLEMSLNSFTQQQDQMRKQFGGIAAPGLGFDEQIRQNMAMFDRAMKMFSPFAFTGALTPGVPGAEDASSTPGKPDASAPATAPSDDSLADLKKQMEAMRAQLDKLASKS